MLIIYDIWDGFIAFMQQGGQVLWLIFALATVMWTLILERTIFYLRGVRDLRQEIAQRWIERADRSSVYAHWMRDSVVSQCRAIINNRMPLIKTCVALCPLFGLLGTVTGMVEVFTVMAVSGGGSARGLAGGVSRATMPTMAGMVAALSGLFAVTWLERKAATEVQRTEDVLVFNYNSGS